MSVSKIVNIAAIVFVGGLVLAMWLVRYLWRRENPPEKEAAEFEAIERRLASPDWAFYEEHLQRPAPAALRELFADRALVRAGGLKYSKSDGISRFNPLDRENLIELAEVIGFDIVPFASSHCGDAIFLRPGKSEPDIVFMVYHDDVGKGPIVFAESVVAMVEQVRKVNEIG